MKKKWMMMTALMVAALAGFPALAQDPAPLGSMESFDLATVKSSVVSTIRTVLIVCAQVFGLLVAFVIYTWAYDKIVDRYGGLY